MHSLSISIVMCVDCLKTVIDCNSAGECVTDSDEIVCDGHVLCPINDNHKLLLYYSLNNDMFELQSINKKITFLLMRRVTFSSHFFPVLVEGLCFNSFCHFVHTKPVLNTPH